MCEYLLSLYYKGLYPYISKTRVILISWPAGACLAHCCCAFFHVTCMVWGACPLSQPIKQLTDLHETSPAA